VTCCGCKINIFHSIFEMGKKIENYILEELFPHITVKKKYLDYSSTLSIWFLLDYEDEIFRNKCGH